MSLVGWNLVLYAGKWVFAGLIFLALGLVLTASRRELSSRKGGQPAFSLASPGRLRVVRPGSDPAFETGMVLDLYPITRMGKDLDNDLVLHDDYVSRKHARLFWDGVGWWIEDLSSKNGTSINGQPCTEHIPQALSDGAKLGIGGMVFELVL